METHFTAKYFTQCFIIQIVTSRCFRYTLPITLENDENKKNISMAEPIFSNTSSHNNIKIILDQLRIKLDIGEKREWYYVGCDGPPYVIASS